MSQRVFLCPGDVHFGQGETRMETVLGSCVAITLRHKASMLGGMCHFLLPQRPAARWTPHHDAVDTRYGEEACALLLEQIRHAGTRMADYRATVMGGADVLPIERQQQASVGALNVAFALDWLKAHQVTPAAVDVAGASYRYIKFDLGNGQVHVRRGPRPQVPPHLPRPRATDTVQSMR